MQNINVIVAGHQFADPGMWIGYLVRRFNTYPSVEVLCEPDQCFLVELNTEYYRMITKAPHHALRYEKDSYRLLLTQPADVIIYVQSVFVEMLHLIQRDFNIVSRLLAARPTCPPVFTLLNDIYCGECGTPLPAEELNQYKIPESRVFRTAIGNLSASEYCARGADEVFDEILKLFNDMRT